MRPLGFIPVIPKPGKISKCQTRRHRRAPDIVELQLTLNRNIDGLNRSHIERGAEDGPFGAGAVVATDVDDECVIKLAQVFHLLDDTTDFVVGIGRVGREDISLTDK
jgi:hypothetical protein